MSALTEDEQLDRAKSLAKKYGSSVVTGILVLLIAFFGWNYWNKKQKVEAQNETARVQQLMDQAQALTPTSDKLALNRLVTAADEIVKKDSNSVQAIQAQFIISKAYFDRGDYVSAERELKKVQSSQLKDAGMIALVNLHLAHAQIAQKKYDEALKTLDLIQLASFKATVNEVRGDIYVAKNDTVNARKAYESAWAAAVERKQQPQVLQIKLENVGVLVEDPNIESPILKTVDES